MCSTTVEKRFGEVNKAWVSVMSKHAGYLTLAYPEDDDVPQDADDWIDTVATEFNKSEKAYTEYLHHVSTGTSGGIPDNLKKSAKASKFERVQLEGAVNSLDKVTKHKDATVDTIKEAQREMKEQLERYRAAQRSHLMLIDDVDEKESVMLQRCKSCASMSTYMRRRRFRL